MKKVLILIGALIVIGLAFWAKGYYNNRYVVSEIYYTQVPTDEVNEESWLVDSKGVKQEKGKEYNLKGYDKDGKVRDVYFSIMGTADKYYAAGTYLQVSMSKTIVVKQGVVSESKVPQAAKDKIQSEGTRLK